MLLLCFSCAYAFMKFTKNGMGWNEKTHKVGLDVGRPTYLPQHFLCIVIVV